MTKKYSEPKLRIANEYCPEEIHVCEDSGIWSRTANGMIFYFDFKKGESQCIFKGPFEAACFVDDRCYLISMDRPGVSRKLHCFECSNPVLVTVRNDLGDAFSPLAVDPVTRHLFFRIGPKSVVRTDSNGVEQSRCQIPFKPLSIAILGHGRFCVGGNGLVFIDEQARTVEVLESDRQLPISSVAFEKQENLLVSAGYVDVSIRDFQEEDREEIYYSQLPVNRCEFDSARKELWLSQTGITDGPPTIDEISIEGIDHDVQVISSGTFALGKIGGAPVVVISHDCTFYLFGRD